MSKKKHRYTSPQNKDPEFREIIDKYIKRWPWFIVCTIVSLILAACYIGMSTPKFQAVASIIINDEDSNGSKNDQGAFTDLGLLKGLRTNSIENELGLLRSHRMISNVVKSLDLNIRYFEKRTIGKKEVYGTSPFRIQLISFDDEKIKQAIENEKNQFEIRYTAKEELEIKNTAHDTIGISRTGSPISTEWATFSIEPNPRYQIPWDESPEMLIEFHSVDGIAQWLRSKIKVDLVEEQATLISLNLIDEIPKRAIDVLNQLVFEYNREAIEDKNLIAENTAFFIDERLRLINQELDSVETGKERFKETNSLANLELGSELIMQNASEYNLKQQEVNTQLELVSSMIRFLGKEKSDLLPSNIGISDVGIQQLIGEYNQLIIEKNKIQVSSTPNNPTVVNLNNQINQLKNNLRTSFQRIRTNLRISRNNLQKQAGIIGSQISDVPAQERQYRDIERQQKIKEALYLYLLEKREENSLSLAATAPKAKIVDQAYILPHQVSPNSSIVFLASLLAGLAIPFVYINAKNLLNNKIRNRNDIKNITKSIPIVGEVPHLGDKNTKIKADDRSNLSEAFRILYTNLQHSIIRGNDESGICFFVTSAIKGEGKTFTAINLAVTLALSSEKVLLVGCDLRNPQLDHYSTTGKTHFGVSSYLDGNRNVLEDLIVQSNLHSNLKLLPSGKIPMNPAELLRNKRCRNMFDNLKKEFDYVVVDTAPAMLLADTFLINQHADMTLFLVRADYTEKKLIDFAIDAKNEGKLKNTCFVLNDVRLTEIGYGNKYGYSYGQLPPNAINLLKLSLKQKIFFLESEVGKFLRWLKK